ncbi:MAG: hypothetical protein MUO31_01250 [Thermodesulfovibrionales bacterium]|nr:hypothetical protein [Thermodesulfovibrionales bacterium]
MNQKTDKLKKSINTIFLLQKTNCEKALEFYDKLESMTDEEESWKYSQEIPFFDTLKELVVQEQGSPVYILERAIATIDEYIEALENFSDDQFAAFLLGIGLNWIPFNYWGVKELDIYLSKIKKAISFYENLEATLSSDELWKVSKKGFLEILPQLIPPAEHKPTYILKTIKELIEGTIEVLADRPF